MNPVRAIMIAGLVAASGLVALVILTVVLLRLEPRLVKSAPFPLPEAVIGLLDPVAQVKREGATSTPQPAAQPSDPVTSPATAATPRPEGTLQPLVRPSPTSQPSVGSTAAPTRAPAATPTRAPTPTPAAAPTATASPKPTATATAAPEPTRTPEPSGDRSGSNRGRG